MTLVVRQANGGDLPRLVELLDQLSLGAPREDLGPPMPEEYRIAFDQITADPHQTLLVAESEGRLVGTLCVIVVPNLSYRARPYAIVENVVVDASVRRQGIGEALMRRALEIAKQTGCYKVSLTSNKTREDSHRFYEALGLKPSHTGFRYDL